MSTLGFAARPWMVMIFLIFPNNQLFSFPFSFFFLLPLVSCPSQSGLMDVLSHLPDRLPKARQRAIPQQSRAPGRGDPSRLRLSGLLFGRDCVGGGGLGPSVLGTGQI